MNDTDTIKTIKKSLTSTTWWQHVQPEVRKRLDFVIENLQPLGILFRDSFVSSFKYAHAFRVVNEVAINNDKPGALFGRNLTEECYHSGIHSTRLLLDIADWTQPNDADVQACMHICQCIDSLEKTDFFKTETENIKTLPVIDGVKFPNIPSLEKKKPRK